MNSNKVKNGHKPEIDTPFVQYTVEEGARFDFNYKTKLKMTFTSCGYEIHFLSLQLNNASKKITQHSDQCSYCTEKAVGCV